MKTELAQGFVNWLVSPAEQAAIDSYKISGGQPLFPERAVMRLCAAATACLGVVVIATGAADAAAQTTAPAAAPAALSVYAAGSLRAALDEMARQFEQAQGTRMSMSYDASGLLKDITVRE